MVSGHNSFQIECCPGTINDNVRSAGPIIKIPEIHIYYSKEKFEPTTMKFPSLAAQPVVREWSLASQSNFDRHTAKRYNEDSLLHRCK